MKVSIVTISYNQAPYLEQAICSVIEQDYPDIEYIVVDPGSTDGSRNIIEHYRNRIAHVILEPDNGPADGLNNGFARATGDVFGYINADDYFVDGAIRFATNYFSIHPNVDVFSGAVLIVDAKGKKRIRKRTSDHFDLKNFIAGTCLICQQATFFRKRAYECTEGFNTQNRSCWDIELMVDMAIKGCTFESVFKVLGAFRLHKGSISGSGFMYTAYVRDRRRLEEKIRKSGIVTYTPSQKFARRLFRKINLKRHLDYLIVKT
jgi:glycosyltransferase involved in cell wall biosynthesis